MGQTEVEQEELETFLAIAKDLEVKGLTSEMETKESNEFDTYQSNLMDSLKDDKQSTILSLIWCNTYTTLR